MIFKLIPTCPGLAVMLDVWGPPGMGPAPEVTGVAVTGLALGKPMVPGGGPLGRMPGWGCCWPGCCWGIPCCGILTTPGCWGMLIPGRGPWGPPTIWGAPGGPGCCCCWLAGQIINSVTFFWLFTIKDKCKKVICFQKANQVVSGFRVLGFYLRHSLVLEDMSPATELGKST